MQSCLHSTSDPSVDIESCGSMESHPDSHDARLQSRGSPRARPVSPGAPVHSQECSLVFRAKPSFPCHRTLAHTFVLGIKMFTVMAVSGCVSSGVSFTVRMAFGQILGPSPSEACHRGKQKPDFLWMYRRVKGS